MGLFQHEYVCMHTRYGRLILTLKSEIHCEYDSSCGMLLKSEYNKRVRGSFVLVVISLDRKVVGRYAFRDKLQTPVYQPCLGYVVSRTQDRKT